MPLKYAKKRSALLLSSIHGFVAWCYDKIKSMLDKCWNIKFYGWIFSGRRG